MIKRKPFSTPSWVVGRDFPHPNDRFQGTVPSNPTPARPTQSIPIAPTAAPKPTLPPAPPTVLPPPAPPQSATPPAVRAPSESSSQPPTSSPQNKSNLQPQTSNIQNPSSPQPPVSSPQNKSNLQPQTSNIQNPSNLQPQTSNIQPQASNIQNNHHSGKCSICNHPDRDAIEAAFLNWQPADRIVADFNLPARSTLYRHAKAADLLNQRRNNFRAALDLIIEQAGRVPATAASIISAIELSYRLSGADIAPLKRYETTHIYVNKPNPPSAGLPIESNLQPLASNLENKSGHQNILAPPNSLIPKEGRKINRDTPRVHQNQGSGRKRGRRNSNPGAGVHDRPELAVGVRPRRQPQNSLGKEP